MLTYPGSEGKEGEEESMERGAEEIGLAFSTAEIRYGILTRDGGYYKDPGHSESLGPGCAYRSQAQWERLGNSGLGQP